MSRGDFIFEFLWPARPIGSLRILWAGKTPECRASVWSDADRRPGRQCPENCLPVKLLTVADKWHDLGRVASAGSANWTTSPGPRLSRCLACWPPTPCA